jgi:hypothetical protein
MSESDTEASTGDLSARRCSQRTIQKPNRLIDDLERAVGTKTQVEPQRNRINKQTRTNASVEDINATTDTEATLNTIIKKIKTQDADLRKLHLLLQTKDREQKRALEEQEKQHQEEILSLQSRIDELNKTIESYQIDELKKTVQEIHETTSTKTTTSTTPTTQTPSGGRSWASVVTASSAISPATKATTAALTLPNVTINVRNADEDTKRELADGATAKSAIQNALKKHQDTGEVRIEGVKVTPGSIVRVFLAGEGDVRMMREHQQWLRTFNGAKLNGEPWFPIKIDSVRKSDVFEKNGEVREEFYGKFRDENNTEVRKLYWLSGPKSYGSMVIFLPQESDATRLLHQKMVQICGEVSFTSEYHYIQRPLRCRNCQGYGHKQSRCRLPAVCERCSGPHQKQECNEHGEKCGACGGTHQASDQQCPRWQEEVNRIRGGKQTQSCQGSSLSQNS